MSATLDRLVEAAKEAERALVDLRVCCAREHQLGIPVEARRSWGLRGNECDKALDHIRAALAALDAGEAVTEREER